MINKLKYIYCWWNGHDWDSVHGYRNLPNDGANCRRCTYKYHE
jgi:hypothetical protein